MQQWHPHCTAASDKRNRKNMNPWQGQRGNFGGLLKMTPPTAAAAQSHSVAAQTALMSKISTADTGCPVIMSLI